MSQGFMFLDNLLSIILNIWYIIWSIRQFKFIIPCWRWHFKFIVSVWLFCLFTMNNKCYELIKQHIYNSSVRLSIRVWGWEVLLIFEFINIVSILFYIAFTVFLYTFLICFAGYEEYMIWRIPFSKLSDVITYFYLCKCYWKTVKHLCRS